MLDFPRWKVWLVILTTAICVALSIPSLIPKSVEANMPPWVGDMRISLGLDLAGGSHLLLEADTADVAKVQLEKMEEIVRAEMRRDPRIGVGDISSADGRLSFLVRDSAQLDTAVERIRAQTVGIGVSGQRDYDVSVVDTTRIIVKPTAAGIADATKKAIETAVDVVRRRVDPDGTREVTVIQQGSNRILVQVPGVDDPQALKALIGKTARLEFKLVDMTANPLEVAQGRAPPGSQILAYPSSPGGMAAIAAVPIPNVSDPKNPLPPGTPVIAVKRLAMVSGDELIDANQTFDPRTNQPDIGIRFNNSGAKKFARVTTENVNRPFAIILDGVVLSAPNINEPITGGQASISGSFTVKSANDLAISLRSGKLPVALKVVEERTVSPELGADSIQKGVLAGIVGTLALILFMLVTYMRFGVYTTIALIVNAFMILGIMAMFNATLTLPGIAGFVLTIGAAVDANVLINERIREEVRRGRHTIQAVEFGYKEASRAIFDANITNVISAVIMFAFGSGPIRGFAVVLAIGIVTSVFTGVTFTRLMVSEWLQRARPKQIVI